MVENRTEQLDAIFHALSDRTRRDILARLSKGESGVTELAKPFHMSLAAVSKHIKVLEGAGLIEKTKEGRNFCCRANFSSFDMVNELLEQLSSYWNTQLNSLENFLMNDVPTEGEPDANRRSAVHSKAGNSKNPPRKKRKGV